MTHSPLSSKMCSVLRSFMPTICALAVLVLSSRLSVADNVYAEKGSTVELPCPCHRCSEERRETNWYFDQGNTAINLFLQTQRNNIKRYPAAWNRLEMLANSSLRFYNVVDNDTGRYWCHSNTYYDLVVVTGTKQMVESTRADSVCYILSCSTVKNIEHSKVRWWEGKKELQDEEKKGGARILRGVWTSQLHICMRKATAGDQEGMKAKERRVKCSFADRMGITFNLTAGTAEHGCLAVPQPSAAHGGSFPQEKRREGVVKEAAAKEGSSLSYAGRTEDCLSVCPNATQCLESGGHGGTWIPLAACVTLLLAVVLALGLALWRKTHGRKHENYYDKVNRDVSKPKHGTQLYENVRTRSETA